MRTASLFLLATIVACGGDEADGPIPSRQTDSLCEGENRAEAYAPGLEKVAESGVRIRLLDVAVEGVANEPDVGDNTWRFELADDGAQPMTSATLSVRTWMPDHGHGTSPNNLEARPVDGSPGTYEIGPFNLFMGGFWTFDVSVNGEQTPVQFAFCLEG